MKYTEYTYAYTNAVPQEEAQLKKELWYNDKEQLIKSIEHSANGQEGKSSHFEYEQNRLVSEKHLFASSIFLSELRYSYPNDLTTRIDHLNQQGNIVKTDFKKYNEQGLLIIERSMNTEQIMTEEKKYHYKGQVIEIEEKLKSGERYFTQIELDAQGNQVSYHKHQIDYPKISTKKQQKFDANNRLLECLEEKNEMEQSQLLYFYKAEQSSWFEQKVLINGEIKFLIRREQEVDSLSH